MLQAIRERSTGLVAGFIIAVICLLFAFGGIGSYFTGNTNPTVAEVGDTEITYSQFQSSYQNRLNAAQRQGNANEALIKQQAIQQLVENAVLRNYADNEGYTVTNKQVADYLATNPFLQEDGKFSRARYDELLQMMRSTSEQYTGRVKEDLAVQHFTAGVSESSLLTSLETAQGYALESEERLVSLVKIDPVALADKQEVSDTEAQERYAENKADFFTEERIKLDYLELSADTIAASIEVSDDDLAARYDADKALYTAAETRRASHILLKPNDDRDLEAAKQELAALKSRIEAGENFAELAKEHSDDVGSGLKGGDLDFFGKGRMVPEFEAAAFALAAEGDLSDLVETQYGVHLIKLTGIKPEAVKPLEEVKDKVAKAIKKERAEEQFIVLSDKLADLTYDNPATLQKAADELKLDIQTSAWITPNAGAGIGGRGAVRRAAFDKLVTTDGENSDRIEIGDNKVIVIRKNEYQAARQQTLEEVKPTIVKALQAEKAAQVTVELAAKIKADVEAGQALAAAATASELEAEDATIKRSERSFKPAVVDAVFAAAKPAADKATIATAVTADNVQYVIAVNKINVADAEATEAQLKGVKARLARERGNAELAALLKAVRSNTNIAIHEERL